MRIPAALRLGTHQDNLRDRQLNGDYGKLTDDDVRDIRDRSADCETNMALADEYDVDQSVISRTVNRRAYPHVE